MPGEVEGTFSVCLFGGIENWQPLRPFWWQLHQKTSPSTIKATTSSDKSIHFLPLLSHNSYPTTTWKVNTARLASFFMFVFLFVVDNDNVAFVWYLLLWQWDSSLVILFLQRHCIDLTILYFLFRLLQQDICRGRKETFEKQRISSCVCCQKQVSSHRNTTRINTEKDCKYNTRRVVKNHGAIYIRQSWN